MSRNDMAFWAGLATLFFGVYVGAYFLAGIGGGLVLMAYFLAPKNTLHAVVNIQGDAPAVETLKKQVQRGS